MSTQTSQLSRIGRCQQPYSFHVGGGAVAQWVRALAWTGDWTLSAGLEYHCGKLCFGTLAIPFTPLCQCLSEETLKAVGPFYLVSMPGKYKIPPVRTGMCNCRGLHHS